MKELDHGAFNQELVFPQHVQYRCQFHLVLSRII